MTTLVPAPPPARPSATVMLLRETAGRLEVLLQRRASTLWFGGTWVYPGGMVDPGDGDYASEPLAAARHALLTRRFPDRLAEPEPELAA